MTRLHHAGLGHGNRPQAALLHAAFRELHGRRLHGFALLVSLGDRAAAAQAVSDALSAAHERLDELGHPERAAAWLRARVVEALRRRDNRASRLDEKEYRASLRPLGVELPVASGLAGLTTVERAALVASDIERLDPRDVAIVTGTATARTARLLRRAREAYQRGYVARALLTGPGHTPAPQGPLGTEIREVAHRTFSPFEDRR